MLSSKRKLFFGIVFVGIFLYVLSAMETFAAQGTLEGDISEMNIGDQFETRFFLDTEGSEINAIAGKIFFPNTFMFEEIRIGNSLINFWVDEPRLTDPCSAVCEIPFSGIIPGGYNSRRGLVFSFVLTSSAQGNGRIYAENAKVLLNDGLGTELPMRVEEYGVRVSSEIPETARVAPRVDDRDKPEVFTPVISQDQNIYDGKWFLAFVTQDKGSGVAGYYVYEKRDPALNVADGEMLPVNARWVVAQSPYVLTDQELRSHVFVKAVDAVGNERIVVVSPGNSAARYESVHKNSIIVLGIVMAFGILFLLGKKNKLLRFK